MSEVDESDEILSVSTEGNVFLPDPKKGKKRRGGYWASKQTILTAR